MANELTGVNSSKYSKDAVNHDSAEIKWGMDADVAHSIAADQTVNGTGEVLSYGDVDPTKLHHVQIKVIGDVGATGCKAVELNGAADFSDAPMYAFLGGAPLSGLFKGPLYARAVTLFSGATSTGDMKIMKWIGQLKAA